MAGETNWLMRPHFEVVLISSINMIVGCRFLSVEPDLETLCFLPLPATISSASRALTAGQTQPAPV